MLLLFTATAPAGGSAEPAPTINDPDHTATPRGASGRQAPPIENAFAKLKALLLKAAERIVGTLWDSIGIILDACTPAECANYFAAAGYDAL